MRKVMKIKQTWHGLSLCASLSLGLVGLGLTASPSQAADKIVVGMAIASSGFMTAYDQPAAQAAKIKIDEINAAGGLMGRQIEVVEADTKSDQAEGAKAGLAVLDKGADLVIVSCDYDFGSPAALAAQQRGKISFFLCAESIKAGIQGVGPYSFSASILAAVQGATMMEWAYHKKKARTFYQLKDTWTEYNKGICDGFDWMESTGSLKDAKIVGKDTFKNDDPSISAQISRIKALAKEPDAIQLCTMMPGAPSAIKQIRAAGINSMILNGSGVDGNYWINAVPNLTNFFVPVQGSVYGDDPNKAIEQFNQNFAKKYGARPVTQYTYPGYVLIELWAKAVTRAKSVDSKPVVAELEKMKNEPTLFGPRSFSAQLHHQNQGLYLIAEITGGKGKIVDRWQISKPIPLDALLKK
ncbi:MAG: ABC transporter substrate-binding protein [Candidatus Symbiobacter sp.]|nr:ABC transporter substrate-binding protein [Candidatus Symbiobacter sp.]